MNYFVTAIGTDSGKTLVSAILCEALHADYWKPVQAGLPLDRDRVKELVTNKTTSFHEEGFFLKTPASPHAAAKLDDIKIELNTLKLPATSNDLVIEGAGGCLVPLNDDNFVIDLVSQFECNIVLVADLYLGSINHTLLTVQELRRRGLKVKGIIFNGDTNPESERIILHHSNIRCILNIEKEPVINSDIVKKYADQLLMNWYE
ncbi:MAG: dethiobiotin synthase [Chryseolinea sp.]